MARSGVRIQVLLPTDLAEEVESISKSEGVSLSRVIGSIVQEHRPSREFQDRLLRSKAKVNQVRDTVLRSLEDTGVSQDKMNAILAAIDGLQS